MPTDYENAVADFNTADEHYKNLEEYVSSGRAVIDLMNSSFSASRDYDSVTAAWGNVWSQLHAALEDRNAKLKRAKDLLRQSVQLNESQWRGIDGKPTLVSVGDFKVSSVTWRSWDATDLFEAVKNKGEQKLAELMSLTKLDKNGQTVPVVRTKWDIDFDVVLNWLKANKFDDVIDFAYDETEKTPTVKGPKVLGFLGEKKDD